ncbi:hypothetical protein LPJ73_004577, partial [Coemansia sp. RSA 2703]
MVNAEKHGGSYINQDLNYDCPTTPGLEPPTQSATASPSATATAADAIAGSSSAIAADSADTGAPLTSVSTSDSTSTNVYEGDVLEDSASAAAAVAAKTAAAAGSDSVIDIAADDAVDAGPVLGPGVPPPFTDGKESVEFQIGNHVVDLFDILASRDNDGNGRSRRRYQLVHNNPLLRHMRDATNNMLRSSPSSTTIASGESEQTRQGDDDQHQEQQCESPVSADSGENGDATPAAQGSSGAGGADISLAEVLDSLQYVVNYRLKGRQQPHLDADLMRRLCDALMLTMTIMQGSFVHKRLTEDARSAYFLFGQFIEEVNEFQHCVGEKPVADLRRALKLHKRITDGGPEEEKLALVTILRLVLACLPPGNDWRDLVDEHEQRTIAPIVEKYSQIIEDDTASYHMPVTGGVIFPSPSLYFDRTVEKLEAMFKTDVVNGLSSDQVDERREFYGRNILPRPVRRPWWKIVWAQLTDLMILLLCVAIIATAVDG